MQCKRLHLVQLLILAFLGILGGQAYAVPFTEQVKLTADEPMELADFGACVAISGDTAVVSSLDLFNSAPSSVYVFVRNGTVWSLQQRLTADDAAPHVGFGSSLAISGDTVVVGSPYDDDAGPGSGSVYVFVRNGTSWSQQQKLAPSDARDSLLFGDAVAISGDTIVVGSPGVSFGAAYVFVRSGTSWSQQQKLTADPARPAFGLSVAIAGDTLVVGFPFDDTAGTAAGSAYVFVRSGFVWSQQQKLTAQDGAASDVFGNAVAVSGETVMVGAQNDDDAGDFSGSAYVFTRSGTVWSQQQKLTASDAALHDFFGTSLAIDGEIAVIGTPFESLNRGAAYVFLRSGTTWSQQQKLVASDATPGVGFANSVALSGTTILVGTPGDDVDAPNSGSAYIFVRNDPPDCSGEHASVATLWPPDHRLVDVSIQGVTDPDGDPLTLRIDRVVQTEPTTDGQICPDAQGIGTPVVQLRAERSPLGEGRGYRLFFTATDGKGGRCSGSVDVCVPHSAAENCNYGVPAFDSTSCSGN
jgi:FG-GAP repeat protein